MTGKLFKSRPKGMSEKKINDEDDFNVDVESLLLHFITIIRGIMRYIHKLKERHNVFHLIRREKKGEEEKV